MNESITCRISLMFVNLNFPRERLVSWQRLTVATPVKTTSGLYTVVRFHNDAE